MYDSYFENFWQMFPVTDMTQISARPTFMQIFSALGLTLLPASCSQKILFHIQTFQTKFAFCISYRIYLKTRNSVKMLQSTNYSLIFSNLNDRYYRRVLLVTKLTKISAWPTFVQNFIVLSLKLQPASYSQETYISCINFETKSAFLAKST